MPSHNEFDPVLYVAYNAQCVGYQMLGDASPSMPLDGSSSTSGIATASSPLSPT